MWCYLTLYMLGKAMGIVLLITEPVTVTPRRSCHTSGYKNPSQTTTGCAETHGDLLRNTLQSSPLGLGHTRHRALLSGAHTPICAPSENLSQPILPETPILEVILFRFQLLSLSKWPQVNYVISLSLFLNYRGKARQGVTPLGCCEHEMTRVRHSASA